LGLLLGPVWSPLILQYNYIGMLFTMRSAGWLRNAIYVVISIMLAAVFWRDWHVNEHYALLGFVLLAALLIPIQKPSELEQSGEENHERPTDTSG
jgi:hypothetical protein